MGFCLDLVAKLERTWPPHSISATNYCTNPAVCSRNLAKTQRSTNRVEQRPATAVRSGGVRTEHRGPVCPLGDFAVYGIAVLAPDAASAPDMTEHGGRRIPFANLVERGARREREASHDGGGVERLPASGGSEVGGAASASRGRVSSRLAGARAEAERAADLLAQLIRLLERQRLHLRPRSVPDSA
eukprot:776360-Rhodomonas_salina.4